jgi:hypothetical protein
VGAKIRPRGPEGPNTLSKSDHAVISIDHHGVEAKHHTEGMNRIGGENPDARFRLERSFAKQANQAAQNKISNANTQRQNSPLRFVKDGYRSALRRHLASGAGSGRSVLHPEDQHDQHDEREHACDYANHCDAIHSSPLPFPVLFIVELHSCLSAITGQSPATIAAG